MRKRVSCIILVLCMCLGLSACGGSSDSAVAGMNSLVGTMDAFESETQSVAVSETLMSNGAVEPEYEQVANTNRKLVTTVNMDVETKEYDDLVGWIMSSVSGSNGYVESSNMYSHNEDSRSCDLTIRIPKGALDIFIEDLGDRSNVLRKSMNEDDVTLKYTDNESHKKSLLVEQERLLELLEQAGSLEDILNIEDRLTQVRYSLESYESILRTMDNQIDYSTVYLNVREVRELTEPEPETWFERAGKGIRENVDLIRIFFAELSLFIVTHSPAFVLLGVFVFVLVLIIRKSEKKRKLKREALQRQYQRQMDDNNE